MKKTKKKIDKELYRFKKKVKNLSEERKKLIVQIHGKKETSISLLKLLLWEKIEMKLFEKKKENISLKE